MTKTKVINFPSQVGDTCYRRRDNSRGTIVAEYSDGSVDVLFPRRRRPVNLSPEKVWFI